MAGDHERYQRPDHKEATKASALGRFLDSSEFLIAVLVVLGALNYGWVLFPTLGLAWGLINGTIVAGIVIAGVAVRLRR